MACVVVCCHGVLSWCVVMVCNDVSCPTFSDFVMCADNAAAAADDDDDDDDDNDDGTPKLKPYVQSPRAQGPACVSCPALPRQYFLCEPLKRP